MLHTIWFNLHNILKNQKTVEIGEQISGCQEKGMGVRWEMGMNTKRYVLMKQFQTVVYLNRGGRYMNLYMGQYFIKLCTYTHKMNEINHMGKIE